MTAARVAESPALERVEYAARRAVAAAGRLRWVNRGVARRAPARRATRAARTQIMATGVESSVESSVNRCSLRAGRLDEKRPRGWAGVSWFMYSYGRPKHENAVRSGLIPSSVVLVLAKARRGFEWRFRMQALAEEGFEGFVGFLATCYALQVNKRNQTPMGKVIIDYLR